MGKGTTQQRPALRVSRTARGVRMWHGRHLVSDVRAAAGPTDSVFDLLGACAHVAAPRAQRFGVLGFAAGGLLAPWRALGATASVEGVDLDTTGAALFEQVAFAYAGAVRVWRADALTWMTERPGRFDVLVEDLSAQVPGDVVKPAVSLEALPACIERGLARSGVVVVNALPTPGYTWDALIDRLVGRWAEVRVCRPAEYENRVLVAAHTLPPASSFGRQLRASLLALGSTLAEGLVVERWRPRRPPSRRSGREEGVLGSGG